MIRDIPDLYSVLLGGNSESQKVNLFILQLQNFSDRRISGDLMQPKIYSWGKWRQLKFNYFYVIPKPKYMGLYGPKRKYIDKSFLRPQ